MLVEVPCAYCGTVHLREKKKVDYFNKLGDKMYCSIECQSKAKTTKIEVPCASCGKMVLKTPSQAAKSKSGNIFCSRTCATKFNNSFYKSGHNHPNYVDGAGGYRERALQHYGAKCTVPGCGYDIEAVLQVHHRDCNRKNNKVENLDVLCPTHHVEYQLGIREY